MKIAILAAGFGNRMEPLSSYITKPLLRIGEKTAIDYVIDLSHNLGLEPIIVTGYSANTIEKHLQSKSDYVEFVRNPKESTNLFDSLLAAEPYLGQDFVWAAASVFFASLEDLRRLIESHNGHLMSMISQKQTKYKPKLKFSSTNLTKFIVGEAPYEFSSPTFFVSNKKIFSYLENYNEFEAIQRAINSGEKFNVIPSNIWSKAIHLPEDYFTIQKQILGKNYISSNSDINSSKVDENVFIYNSSLRNCELSNCIVIDASTSDSTIENCILFGPNGNKLSFSN